jgi:hypothetical protein
MIWLDSALRGGRLSSAVEVVVVGGVFLAIVLALAHLMKVEEVGQLLDPALRRLRKRPR